MAVPRIFDRLIGLETEYAVRFSPVDDGAKPPTKTELIRALLGRIKKRLPTAAAISVKEGIFTANGGAFWLEQASVDPDVGLIEASTPECRSPRELLAYSRAQDRLLESVAQELSLPGRVTLIKNDRDAHDNLYGAQENYEADIGRGAGLFCWRAGLVLILPLVIATWVGMLACIVLLVLALLCGGPIYLILAPWIQLRRKEVIQQWLQTYGAEIAGHLQRLLVLPAAGGLYLVAWLFAFRQQRRELLAFLVTRPLLAGAGMVDRNNHFQLADKAPGINCLLGYGQLVGDFPLFSFGHLLKPLLYEVWHSPRALGRLFAQRQRLQIALGDSNMADEAELLRVGTTLLVLDAIEAGKLRGAPQVWRPLAAVRKVCADVTLTSCLFRNRRTSSTALEVQQFYLQGCRAFLEDCCDAPAEAWEILHLWQDALEALQRDPRELAGRIDWVTKRFLLEQLGPSATWEARKKLDMRYHELSPEGYFRCLQSTEFRAALVDEQTIERAMSFPPARSPATARGRYIREMQSDGQGIYASWEVVRVGTGRRAKVFELTKYE